MAEGYKFPKKTVRDLQLRGKTILLRADFNVPLDQETGEITSDYRIVQTLPTLQYLLERNCKIIIISHLGRPEGKKAKKYSLAPVSRHLQELLPKATVKFVSDCLGDGAYQACKTAKAGEIVLLENLRFYPEEEADDSKFAKQLKQVSGADYFVQDGFGVVHRAHASTGAITELLPSVAGLLLEKEVSALEKAMTSPKHPLVAVVGGAKISDKIEFIERLLQVADTVLIGGAMANTFLKQQGHDIAKSIYESCQDKKIATILQKAKKNQIVLPVDAAVGKEIAKTSQRRDCNLDQVEADDYILDIGFETMRLFQASLAQAETVIWNGPLGYTEAPAFAQGSSVVAEAISNRKAVSIIGGGDTADFILDWQAKHPKSEFSHISTGGGASLELMSGQKLPGVEALIPR